MACQYIQALRFETEDLMNSAGNLRGELSKESATKALAALQLIDEAHLLLCQIECDEEGDDA